MLTRTGVVLSNANKVFFLDEFASGMKFLRVVGNRLTEREEHILFITGFSWIAETQSWQRVVADLAEVGYVFIHLSNNGFDAMEGN